MAAPPERHKPGAVVFAPAGRDAAVAAALLREAGIASTICADFAGLQRSLADDTGFVVVTEEALRDENLRGVIAWLNAQPAWSDLPFIVLTPRGGGTVPSPDGMRLENLLGNVTLLERPFHPLTFVSLARVAVKARQRQFETRARIEELRDAERALREANQTLEERVAARTRELQEAHAAVLAEIEQRKRAEDDLRQAQKLETLGQLTGGVAHDFNNLLMAVIGNLDLLRKRFADHPEAMRFVEGALRGAQRGAALTQRLLLFARRQDLETEPCNLVDLVRGMVDLIERSVGTRIEVCLELPATVPPVMLDTNQIELAILNLAVNARDAMPDGGVLTIGVDTAETAGDVDLAAGTYVRLHVTDTGHGMDEQTLRKAVEPFFSTKDLGKGTGLGLSMIHGLAVQLHGALRLASEVGRGTRAEIWLPVTATTAVEPVTALPAPGGASSRKLSILVVDDDELVAFSTASMLEDLGHDVVAVASGRQALEILAGGDPVDFVVTDYAMPGMNGVEFAARARRLRPALPMLLVSGYAELPQRPPVDLPRLGKPYHQQQLAAEIERQLAARSDGATKPQPVPGEASLAGNRGNAS